MTSSDIIDLEDKIYFTKLYGNTLKVWFDSYLAISIFAPFLLLIPYLLSYREEIDTNFRTCVLVRCGKRKYLINKFFSIAISGTAILALSELLFYTVSGYISYTTVELEFIGELVIYKNTFFC